MLVNRVQGSCQHFLCLSQRRKTSKDQWEWKSRDKEENISYSSIRGSQHSFNVSKVRNKQKTDIFFVTNASELSIRLTQTLARWRNRISRSCVMPRAWADQGSAGYAASPLSLSKHSPISSTSPRAERPESELEMLTTSGMISLYHPFLLNLLSWSHVIPQK